MENNDIIIVEFQNYEDVESYKIYSINKILSMDLKSYVDFGLTSDFLKNNFQNDIIKNANTKESRSQLAVNIILKAGTDLSKTIHKFTYLTK